MADKSDNFKDQVRQVRETASIVEVVSEYVNLKKSGRNHMGLCPFPDHNERTPSFNVNESLRIFKCFGCGRGGDVFTFLQEVEGMSFKESLAELARRYGVSLSMDLTDNSASSSEREHILAVHELAADHYSRQLGQGKDGVAAMDYLKKRGLKEDIIKKFRIGYCPLRDDEFLNTLKKMGYTIQELNGFGLMRGDRPGFAGRVIFPIFDRSSRVVAFGGRMLETINDQGPKYLNSPEHALFHKSNLLYGMNFSARVIKQKRRLIVVEGYMDVIAMHTAGFEETVATLGTALTGKHVSQMIKLTDRILLFLDSDEAGLNAALRVGDIFSTFEHEPYVVTLGQVAKDPDEFIQRFGSELLEQKIDSAGSYMDFLLSQLPKKLDLETFGGKTRAIKQYLTPLLSGGTPLKRSDYARKVSEFLQITIPDLRRLVMENRNQNRTTPQNNQEKTIKRPQMSPVIRDLIASLILKPNLIPEYQKAVSEVGELVTNQRILDLLKEIISSGEKGSMDDIQLQIRENPLYHEITAALMESGESAVELFRGSLVKLREIKINRELSEIEKKMKTLEISGEIDTLTGLQKRFIELSRLRSML